MQGEKGLDAFLKQYRLDNGTKECPWCEMVTDKVSGCNKATCPYCHKYFCWGCLWKSEDAKGAGAVYYHLQQNQQCIHK